MLNPLSDKIEKKLRESLSADTFREFSQSYLEEPRGRHFGVEGLLLAPNNVEDVSKIVSICSESNIGLSLIHI